MRVLDRARGELDDALVVPRARALGVLVGGDAEQQDGRDAERRGLAGLLHGAQIDRRSTPGMAPIGLRPSGPASTNSGRTKSPASSRVSRTRSRSTAVRRRRRMRVAGKGTGPS